jgi:hypothetical protein
MQKEITCTNLIIANFIQLVFIYHRQIMNINIEIKTPADAAPSTGLYAKGVLDRQHTPFCGVIPALTG